MFGWTLDEQRSFAVLDAYREAGGNFIDTADVYGRRGAGGGRLGGDHRPLDGRARQPRRARDRDQGRHVAGAAAGSPRRTIAAACEDSLRRLGIDRIDLYYAHQDDPDTPLEETLGAFGDADRRGQDPLRRGLQLQRPSASRGARGRAARPSWPRYVALQPHYNLMERGYEGELAPLCDAHGLACLPYFGLARGFLTGKYRPGGGRGRQPARGARRARATSTSAAFAVLDALDEIAAAHGAATRPSRSPGCAPSRPCRADRERDARPSSSPSCCVRRARAERRTELERLSAASA